MTTVALKAKDYKSRVKPIWCPGCGHFAVLAAITRALAYLELPKDQVALISGIGCSSRLPAYVDSYGFHGLHGRALPLATGLKVARPELSVLVAGGDGDGFSIGGNHFLHACRRNIDLTYIVMDNRVYGMTKGQASPTTAPDWAESKMTPHGTGVRRFQPAAIALAAGATFIARGYSGDPKGLTRMMVEAITHPGFSFLHVLSPCVTFRPDQRSWKTQVHAFAAGPFNEPVEAARQIHADDGLGLGVLFSERLPVWPPVQEPSGSLPELEREFLI
jgi:2-oxoglutarate ferredoxin oxidoreductase subunit beta